MQPNVVAEECGLSYLRSLWLVSPSFYLPLDVFGAVVRDLEVSTQLLFPSAKCKQWAVVRMTCLYKQWGFDSL